MPARRFPAPQAAASHALAAQERYQAQLRRFAANWMDMELYRRVGDELDEIRQGCREVPELSHAWVELLIAHAELVQSLWQSAGPALAAERHQLVEKVGATAADLEAACMRLLRPRSPS